MLKANPSFTPLLLLWRTALLPETREILYPNLLFGSKWLYKWFLKKEKQETEEFKLRCELW